MAETPFFIGEVIKKGWELTKAHLGFLLGYQVILFLLLILHASLNQHIILSLIVWFALILAKMGFINSTLLISQGIKPGFDQLYTNWRLIVSYILASLFMGVMMLVGLALLIIPGLYVWARFGLYPFFLLNKDLGPIEALKQTSQATKGICWNLFLLFLALTGINILGLLVFGIGLLITAPISLLALATVYLQIKERKFQVS